MQFVIFQNFERNDYNSRVQLESGESLEHQFELVNSWKCPTWRDIDRAQFQSTLFGRQSRWECNRNRSRRLNFKILECFWQQSLWIKGKSRNGNGFKVSLLVKAGLETSGMFRVFSIIYFYLKICFSLKRFSLLQFSIFFFIIREKYKKLLINEFPLNY